MIICLYVLVLVDVLREVFFFNSRSSETDIQLRKPMQSDTIVSSVSGPPTAKRISRKHPSVYSPISDIY
jgi:hypothetical protein